MKTPKKRNKIDRPSITCSYVWHVKCVSTFCESLKKLFLLPNSNAVKFFDVFFRHRSIFCPAQTKSLNNRKSGYVSMISDNIPYF